MRITRDNLLERQHGILKPAQPVLAFADPIERARRERTLSVQFQEQPEAGQRGLIVFVLELRHDMVVEPLRRIGWRGRKNRRAPNAAKAETE